MHFLRAFFCALVIGVLLVPLAKAQHTTEPRHRLSAAYGEQAVALTLDACSGGTDQKLLEFLVAQRIPATLFLTRRWIVRNAPAVAFIKAHRELFAIENHGARHLAAVLGEGRAMYTVPGVGDLAGLRDEMQGGAQAIAAAFGSAPRWYRGATARYDREALAEIARIGFGIAGYSVNADQGASLPRAQVVQRMLAARAGDVIIAHMNHPNAATGAALMETLPQLKARGLKFVKLSDAPLVNER
jgi:peptidoglycan/xylan/chitin deacetylase (PgdA/CDA1 family)